MCGIGGLITDGTLFCGVSQHLEKLQESLAHRGPDDAGQWVDDIGVVGLVQTRLAILDLSEAGHQPMTSLDGRYTIVFNGEIYNFQSLREDLITIGYVFRSHTDTEVLLALYAEYGEEMVSRLAGMFAFAIVDSQLRTVFFARGPMGIKPLYLMHFENGLAFSSEFSALLKLNLISKEINVQSLQQYLLFGSVQDPLTPIQGITSLPAGHTLTWEIGIRGSEQPKPKCYWQLHHPNTLVPKDKAIAVAREAIEESVSRHLVSDVPIGVFLSGGIDSTALVAVMRRLGVKNIKTFSISFDDIEFNEGDVAKRTADHFGTEHHDWCMKAADGVALLKSFLDATDLPSIDGFNTYCVSKLAHDNNMKVVLSGLGGDELFGGYPSFQKVPRISRFHRVASSVGLNGIVGRMMEFYGSRSSIQRAGVCLQMPPHISSAYWAMRGIFTPNEVDKICQNYISGSPKTNCAGMEIGWELGNPPTRLDAVSEMEITRYMVNQLLRDSDVMSMAWGLELRVPFVDSRLVEKLLSIPASIRLRAGKRLLIESVPEIPKWVINRPKMGFVFPFENWAKETLRVDFERVQSDSPVPLNSWFRSWALMSLNHFLTSNGISKFRKDVNLSASND